MNRLTKAILFVGLAITNGAAIAEPSVEVVSREDVEFIPLNPARGDASPKAGVLWGDIREDVPSGALITFADGFASPPHIHNITYRAVVIDGVVHNDDPSAELMWMKPGSFWTQPAGAPHITAVGPGGGTAFLEILSGPYLVEPTRNAFDRGEQPVNLDPGNIVWIGSSDLTWIDHGDDPGSKGLELAFLWGTPEDGVLNGTFAKLPEGFSGDLKSNGVELKAVVIRGRLTHDAESLSPTKTLEPGSYFGSTGDVDHGVRCAVGAECILYVRAKGKYRLVAND
ncbi:MAG: DUF4437 domain-containing protein [Pseudomonadota bacterium]